MSRARSVMLRPVRKARETVRLRTRIRSWWARRSSAPAPQVDGWPADFARWLGRANARQLGAFPDEWRARNDLPPTEPAPIGVVVHAFYPELLPDLLGRLPRIPLDYDLWITNATGAPIELPGDLGRVRNVRILEVANHGRDILPLVQLVNAGYLDPYRVILKVHTKRSPWRRDHETLVGSGREWRDKLLEAVLGDEHDVATILSAFCEQDELGILTGDESVLGKEFWGDNEAQVEGLLRRIEIPLDRSRLRFAAGSMYWARGFVVQGLRAINLTVDDFEPEEGQTNATTAHAVERALGLLAAESGLTVAGRSSLATPADTESYRRLEEGPSPRARLVPFYLPQFHPTPENDRWWNDGFTEWTNVTAAQPVYQGHYQPRLPRDLGFYDLRLDDVRRAQLELAAECGIEGFMYYYYWFAGKRLLDMPIEALRRGDIPQPFCIMWANENWTRRWDGRASDVLIAQDYDDVPAEQFIDDILPFLADDRYMTIDGRKIVAIYRPAQIKNFAKVVMSWRERARAAGVGELFVMNVDVEPTFHGLEGTVDENGLDGSLGFPPHSHHWHWLPHETLGVDPRFRGNLLSYPAMAAKAESQLRSRLERTMFPGVMVGFDNTPRRQWAADVWYGANPYTFRRWLAAAIAAVQDRPLEQRLVFVNAWNEWAESAVLEPTDRFGRTFLLAVRDAATP